MTDHYLAGYLNGPNDGGIMSMADDLLQRTVGSHYIISTVIMVVLCVLVIYFLVRHMRGESFTSNPITTLKMTTGDQFGLGGRENLDSSSTAPAADTDRTTSQFYQLGQDQSKNLMPLATSAAAVLQSSDFNCDKNVAAPTDAWAWMTDVANGPETFTAKPKTDSDFSRKLAGY